jgi:hypothetical protein
LLHEGLGKQETERLVAALGRVVRRGEDAARKNLERHGIFACAGELCASRSRAHTRLVANLDKVGTHRGRESEADLSLAGCGAVVFACILIITFNTRERCLDVELAAREAGARAERALLNGDARYNGLLRHFQRDVAELWRNPAACWKRRNCRCGFEKGNEFAARFFNGERRVING